MDTKTNAKIVRVAGTVWLDMRRYYERNREKVLARQEAKRRAEGAKPHRKPVGTRRVRGKYVVVKVADGVWRDEHRVVMERELGRSLSRHETVHHINGDKHDNKAGELAAAAPPSASGRGCVDVCVLRIPRSCGG